MEDGSGARGARGGGRLLLAGGRLRAMIRDVEVRQAGEKGRGVFALRDFAAGDVIFRRRHAIVVERAGIAALSAEDRMHLCELGWDRFAVLAPPGCFLNHSCDPSAMRSGVKVFAWREIRAGDEMTIDYRLNAFDGESWLCACGADACTGTVGGSFFAMTEERQSLLLPYAPAFIAREYRRRRSVRLRASGPSAPRGAARRRSR
ncbi:MAG: SET domain-containing protein [Chloroflexi bacterium]|nr:SET domain-containing protein [Chloroflexota bacterium]